MPVLSDRFTSLPTSTVVDLLHWFRERKEGFQTLQISGGEPLLHPGVFDILEEGKRLGFICRLQTNGIVLNELSSNEIVKLTEVRVKVSLDGSSAEVHEQFRQKGSFAPVVNGIKVLLAHNVLTGAKTVFTKHNLHDGSSLVRFLGALGVHAFTYNVVEPVGYARSLKNVGVSEYQVTRQIIDVLKLRKYRHLLNGTNILRWHLAQKRVLLDRLPWFIDYKGDVFRGQVFRNMRFRGNIFHDNWHKLFEGRNAGYEKMMCDQRTFALIQSKLNRSSLISNIGVRKAA